LNAAPARIAPVIWKLKELNSWLGWTAKAPAGA